MNPAIWKEPSFTCRQIQAAGRKLKKGEGTPQSIPAFESPDSAELSSPCISFF